MLSRFLFSLLLALALLQSATALADPTRADARRFVVPPASAIHPRSGPQRRMAVPVPRWLPAWSDPSEQRPKRDVRFKSIQRYQGARRAEASEAAAVTETGYISVTEVSSGNSLGYVTAQGANAKTNGIYTVSMDASKALQVTATVGTSRNLVSTGSGATFTHLGAITGFDSPSSSLATGSEAYVTLGGVDATTRFAVPTPGGSTYTSATGDSESIESSIWNYDEDSKAITATWLNEDMSAPVIYSMYDYTVDVLGWTGDVAKFHETYTDVVTQVSFKLVQLPI